MSVQWPLMAQRSLAASVRTSCMQTHHLQPFSTFLKLKAFHQDSTTKARSVVYNTALRFQLAEYINVFI